MFINLTKQRFVSLILTFLLTLNLFYFQRIQKVHADVGSSTIGVFGQVGTILSNIVSSAGETGTTLTGAVGGALASAGEVTVLAGAIAYAGIVGKTMYDVFTEDSTVVQGRDIKLTIQGAFANASAEDIQALEAEITIYASGRISISEAGKAIYSRILTNYYNAEKHVPITTINGQETLLVDFASGDFPTSWSVSDSATTTKMTSLGMATAPVEVGTNIVYVGTALNNDGYFGAEWKWDAPYAENGTFSGTIKGVNFSIDEWVILHMPKSSCTGDVSIAPRLYPTATGLKVLTGDNTTYTIADVVAFPEGVTWDTKIIPALTLNPTETAVTETTADSITSTVSDTAIELDSIGDTLNTDTSILGQILQTVVGIGTAVTAVPDLIGQISVKVGTLADSIGESISSAIALAIAGVETKVQSISDTITDTVTPAEAPTDPADPTKPNPSFPDIFGLFKWIVLCIVAMIGFLLAMLTFLTRMATIGSSSSMLNTDMVQGLTWVRGIKIGHTTDTVINGHGTMPNGTYWERAYHIASNVDGLTLEQLFNILVGLFLLIYLARLINGRAGSMYENMQFDLGLIAREEYKDMEKAQRIAERDYNAELRDAERQQRQAERESKAEERRMERENQFEFKVGTERYNRYKANYQEFLDNKKKIDLRKPKDSGGDSDE